MASKPGGSIATDVGWAIGLAAHRTVAPVEGMHRAIAEPWFAALGPIGRPVELGHHSVSRAVYGSIRLGTSAVGALFGARTAPDSPRTAATRAIVTGLWGNALATLPDGMSVQHRGEPISTFDDLGSQLPDAGGRLVVLVHGLMKTESCWQGTPARPGLTERLDDHRGLTTVTVRYNTGLPIEANGARLASLLDTLCRKWPVPLESIALVGHSMGGLVVRHACVAGLRAHQDWVHRVGDVVAIGSPHRGAPLEKLINAATHTLRIAPQTRPLADFLDTRSQGIKDLRHGIDPEVAAAELPHIEHHFVAGVITTSPTHPLGTLIGDLVVRPASGTGEPGVEAANVVVLGGVHHFDLLHDPTVMSHVVAWLDPAEPQDSFPSREV